MSKKVCVTGADGFIGSHLVELLIKSGLNVKAFCFYNSNSSWGWLDKLDNHIKKDLEVVLGDIRDFQLVKNAMKDCNEVYHLASLIAIPYSYIAPSSYVDTNIHGTLNVVQAARDLNIDKVIHTSTSETYGTAQFVPINESHPLVGQSPYAASKIGADQIALSFWRSFKTPVTILRPFNTYGPRQSARAIIPTIITRIASGSRNIKLGTISPTRDFNFVLDTCSAFLSASESSRTIGKVLNVANNYEISIGDLALLIAEVMNVEIKIDTDKARIRPENSEVNRLFGDYSLINSLTGWEPNFKGLEGLKCGLEITAEWFSNPENLNFYKANDYMI